jgi:aconitate hydratase
VQANYLASPPLVVAYALAGSTQIDLSKEPLGLGSDGKPVFLKDIWPTNKEIQSFIAKNVTKKMFKSKYADVFKGDANWQAVEVAGGQTYKWNMSSTSRRPARSRSIRQRADICRSVRSRCRTSTSTARGAATTRS